MTRSDGLDTVSGTSSLFGRLGFQGCPCSSLTTFFEGSSWMVGGRKRIQFVRLLYCRPFAGIYVSRGKDCSLEYEDRV